jgi:predicted nuclease of predicted toxin-antitoxin system
VKFFFDNCVSPKLARAINELDSDAEIIHLKDKFPENTEDPVWLKYVGENDYFVITADKKIKKRVAEKEIYKDFKVGVFVIKITSGKGILDITIQLLKNWEAMKEIAQREKKPFMFKVPDRGKKIEKENIY